MTTHLPWLVLACLAVAPPSPAQTRPSVALVGSLHDDNTERLMVILRDSGLPPRLVQRVVCGPLALRLADVVVVDWPDVARDAGARPFGELERWNVPTVFLGACGEHFARGFGLPTAAEIAQMPQHVRGPEMEVVSWPGDSQVQIWRQGHLFYFGSSAAETWSAADREALARTIALAARFVIDRPFVRPVVASGEPLPGPEPERRQRIDAGAQLLERDVRQLETLVALPKLHDGPALLHDLVADGPGADTSVNNWTNWLRGRSDKMVWDELSHVWRLDPVACARGVPSRTLRGNARADGAGRDPDALALAAKVVQRYGGRAFGDLSTFACWVGEVRMLWDRREGCFRLENHGVLPPGARATSWQVAVLDTAADRDAIWGGGPAPRPRVSARGRFRDLLTRVFLPVMLLDPGTTLIRRADADSAGQQALVVQLAHRGLGAAELQLMVVAGTGEIVSVTERADSPRPQTWLLVATTPCGPLLLPTTWRLDGARRPTEFCVEDPTWNPELPTSLDTATEMLTQPRAR
jgi:hypothetical protein